MWGGGCTGCRVPRGARVSRRARAGRCLCLVQAGRRPGGGWCSELLLQAMDGSTPLRPGVLHILYEPRRRAHRCCVCLSVNNIIRLCSISPLLLLPTHLFVPACVCVCGGRGWWVCACVSKHLHTSVFTMYSCSYVCLPVRAHPLVYLKCMDTRGPQARRSW